MLDSIRPDLFTGSFSIFRMEKLPITEPLIAITSETEAWSTYVDPIVVSLLSSPEEGVHLRW
jgi:hypothetical protein